MIGNTNFIGLFQFSFSDKICYPKVQYSKYINTYNTNTNISLFFVKNFKMDIENLQCRFFHDNKIDQFFLVECTFNSTIYFLVSGEKFLKKDWIIEIQENLKFLIKKYLKNLKQPVSFQCEQSFNSNFSSGYMGEKIDTTIDFEFIDLTYYTPKIHIKTKTIQTDKKAIQITQTDTKPRRVRTISGALRRIFSCIETDIYKQIEPKLQKIELQIKESGSIKGISSIINITSTQQIRLNKDLKQYHNFLNFYTILGNQLNLDRIYIGVKHNHKIPKFTNTNEKNFQTTLFSKAKRDNENIENKSSVSTIPNIQILTFKNSHSSFVMLNEKDLEIHNMAKKIIILTSELYKKIGKQNILVLQDKTSNFKISIVN